MKTKLCYFIMLLLYISCQDKGENQESGLLTVKVRPNNILKLSTITDDVKFIRLSDDILIRDVSKLLLDENENMYILDSKGNGVFKFDKTGKFVTQISRKGQGPGEYTGICDFDIYRDRMLINDGEKQLFYDLNGTYISEQRENFPNSVAWVNDTICESYGIQSLSVYVNGKQTEFFKTVFTEDDLLASHDFHLTKNKDQIYWEDCYNDTIYTISGGKPIPYLFVDFGDLKLPPDIPIDNTIVTNDRRRKYCIDISRFKISDYYLSFSFRHSDYIYACIYNRQTSESHVYNSINNDINFATPGFFPMFIKDKTFYFVSESERISHYYTSLKESSNKEEQEMASRLLEAVGGKINEMDNPYIMVVISK